jgi:hypothetical protein
VLELRKKHEIKNTGKPPPVKSTVGLVLDNNAVTMVVPGGPAYKPVNGKRIEKSDSVLAIDPDGKSGFTTVTPANVISLLRGPDRVGSMVKLQVKQGAKDPIDFNLKRADFRQVEKIKDVYMKLAELGTAAKAPKPDVIQKITRELENGVGVLNDWTSMVETLLREHVSDLEDLVDSNFSLLENERATATEERIRLNADVQQQQDEKEDVKKESDRLLADAGDKYNKLRAEFEAFKASAAAELSATKEKAQQDVSTRDGTIAERDAEIEELKARIAALEGDLANAQAKLAEGDKLSAGKDDEIKALKDILAERDAELAELARLLQEARADACGLRAEMVSDACRTLCLTHPTPRVMIV